MADDDKYPTESGRRRFVKGVEIQDDGTIKGVWPEVTTVEEAGREIQVAEMELGGTTYTSEWFQYCGVQTYGGIQPDYESDNVIRAASGPPYDWQSEELSAGDPLNISQFEDYEEFDTGIGQGGLGKPAMGTWRSQDAENTIPVQVLRAPQVGQLAENDDFMAAATAQDTMAWLDKCTHFCCVPAYKAYEQSGQFGGADKVYCQCHQSIYDPFSVVTKSFVALPRPE